MREALTTARAAIEALIDCVPDYTDGRNDAAVEFGTDAIKAIDAALAAPPPRDPGAVVTISFTAEDAPQFLKDKLK